MGESKLQIDYYQDKLWVNLNAPKRLNAMDLAMARQFQETLDAYFPVGLPPLAQALIIQSEGGCFCAGGDIKSLYYASESEADAFIEAEYHLIRRIYQLPVPTLALAKGACMGGGFGLWMACQVRLAHVCVGLAMPEVAIGLYPDALSGLFLPRLGPLGRVLSLTGQGLNAPQALALQLATALVDTHQAQQLLEGDKLDALLTQGDFGASRGLSNGLSGNLSSLPSGGLLSPFEVHKEALAKAGLPWPAHLAPFESAPGPWSGARDSSSLDAIKQWSALFELFEKQPQAPSYQAFWQSAQKGLAGASKLSLYLSDLHFTQSLRLYQHAKAHWQDAPHKWVDAVCQLEIALSKAVVRHGEFHEGVRAKLVDKDDAPKWRHDSLAELSAKDVAPFEEATYEVLTSVGLSKR